MARRTFTSFRRSEGSSSEDLDHESETLSARLRAMDPRDSIISTYSINSALFDSLPPRTTPIPPSYHSVARPPPPTTDRSYFVDVAFLVDVTGSMQLWIDAVHQKLDEIINAINVKFPTAILRMAFVGYRDYTDDEPVVSMDFRENPRELQDFVRSVVATGGSDQAEDIFAGLDCLLGLSWQSRYRHLIHIADAPNHGLRFHEPHIGDDFPYGIPGTHATAETLLLQLCQKRIQYNFLRLNETTNKMVDEFNVVLRRYQKKITVTGLKSPASDFVPAVVGSIASSLPPVYTS